MKLRARAISCGALLSGMFLACAAPRSEESSFARGAQPSDTRAPDATARQSTSPAGWEREVERLDAASDPAEWQRAIDTRPRDVAWPRATVELLARHAVATLGACVTNEAFSAPGDALAWLVVAEQRLARAENELALVAFARAGARVTTPKLADLLRVGEARALIRLGRSDAARTPLATIAARPDPETARAALAWLGAVELASERPRLAETLLARALALNSAHAWPEHAQAEANLGVALLTNGDEGGGLAHLRAARALFASAGRAVDVAQTFENEIAYFDAAGRSAEASRARAEFELARRR